MKCLEILIKSARKTRKKAENSGIGAKFYSFISFFSIVSLLAAFTARPSEAPKPIADEDRLNPPEVADAPEAKKVLTPS